MDGRSQSSTVQTQSQHSPISVNIDDVALMSSQCRFTYFGFFRQAAKLHEGLGRAYALLFAERGASVVVNDLGGGRHGDGSSTKAADIVVQEIRSKGGKAAANYNSVEDGEKIIQTALDNFGRIDVVVNNAGILRDRSFARISNTDWDLIQQVHLKGTFKTTQAAWPHFRKQNYGRVIVTSSNSGLYGNFGQANYAAAKIGVVGLSSTLAIEGRKNNIHCNAIVPTAASRMTEDILPPDFFAELKPELIAPVVVWLCHESCSETGSIIEAAAGWAGKSYLVRSQGSLLRSKITDNVTPEDVKEHWGTVTDMSNAKHYPSIADVSATLTVALEEMKANAQSDSLSKVATNSLSYDKRDIILYSLGVGASLNNPEDLKYLYEGHEAFSALPTFLIIPAITTLLGANIIGDVFPGKDIDLTKMLHGEQYLEVIRPLETSGELVSKARVVDVLDKGSGAAILVDGSSSIPSSPSLSLDFRCSLFILVASKVPQTVMSSTAIYSSYMQSGANLCHVSSSHGRVKVRGADKGAVYGPGCGFMKGPTCGSVEGHGWELASTGSGLSGSSALVAAGSIQTAASSLTVDTFDENGNQVAYNQVTTFAIGMGGFGGKRTSDKAVDIANAPARAPDATVTEKTSLDQAAIYRLSGDWNPLHIDQDMATLGGYRRPILHGLCTLGFSARHILQRFANNDSSKFKAIKARFSKPVLPGQTLQTNMWHEGSRIHFETKVLESGYTVIGGAYVDLTETVPFLRTNNVSATETLKSEAVFDAFKKRIEANLEKVKKINGVFQYNITVGGNTAGSWTIDLKKGVLYKGPVKEGKVDCTLTMSDPDFVDLFAGKLNPQMAFMQGKLKVAGNLMLVQKLSGLMKEQSKL
uniref:Peroxisomal multifunctional enzyme type 2 n=1 Tax=Timema cristinae TaxID=61476 RepID=A0A7R9GYU0_TIMCR|nr:unnamed protein product [Timema cristinae]